MSTLFWLRDLESDANSVKTTLSSWDGCMSKTWCKWPAIIGIIIGVLFVFSILFCLFRCLCCGLECCCGCLACFNACCPSPRRKRPHDGYQEQSPYYDPRRGQYQGQPQYTSPSAPVYGSNAPYPRDIGAKTATFVTAHKEDTMSGGIGNKYNEDALPAMPSWNAAVSRRVEESDEEVEMDKLEPKHAQQRSLMAPNGRDGQSYAQEKTIEAGESVLPPTNPYRNQGTRPNQTYSPVNRSPQPLQQPSYAYKPPQSHQQSPYGQGTTGLAQQQVQDQMLYDGHGQASYSAQPSYGQNEHDQMVSPISGPPYHFSAAHNAPGSAMADNHMHGLPTPTSPTYGAVAPRPSPYVDQQPLPPTPVSAAYNTQSPAMRPYGHATSASPPLSAADPWAQAKPYEVQTPARPQYATYNPNATTSHAPGGVAVAMPDGPMP